MAGKAKTVGKWALPQNLWVKNRHFDNVVIPECSYRESRALKDGFPLKDLRKSRKWGSRLAPPHV